MPTRAGMGLLLLLVIMLIGAINYQNSLIYVVVFTLGSLFWVGLHHTYRNLAGLELHASGSQPVFCGEEASLGIALVSARREHQAIVLDRKSTRLNSSHVRISYAVFCLKK